MSIKRKYLIPRVIALLSLLLFIPTLILFSYLNITLNQIIVFGMTYLSVCYFLAHYKKEKRLSEANLFQKAYTFLDRHLKYRPFDIQTRQIEKLWRKQIEDGAACNFEAPPDLRYFPDRCYLKGISFVLKARKLNLNSFSFKTMVFVLTGLFFMLFPLLIWEFPEEIKGADREQH